MYMQVWMSLHTQTYAHTKKYKVKKITSNDFIFLRFYLFFREREGERNREISMCGYLLSAPNWDLACNPGMCPDWELNR